MVLALICGGSAVACDSDDGGDSDTSAATEGSDGSSGADASASGDSEASAGSTASGSTTGDDSDTAVTTDDASTSADPPTTSAATTDDPSGGSSGEPEPDLPPTDLAALEQWLEAGEYLGWQAESAPHASTGPHFGTVRTFFNAALFESFESGATTHPIGAANVKELYGQGAEVRGWSVMAKHPQDDGQWYWYEIYDGDVLAEGVGLTLCENCHGAGTDQVLTPFPLQ